MSRGNQLTRQWRLLQLLDRPAGVAVADAARELDCAVRTVWRDLHVLEDAGFPIYDEKSPDGPRGIWKIEESFKAKLPLKLSLPELAALLMSRELVAPLGASILGAAVSSAFDKISGILSRDALTILDRIRDTIGVRAFGAKLQQPVAEHLPAIQTGLMERRTIDVRYHSFGRDEETRRSIDPYHLTYFNGGLYLVGYCHLRRAVRIFAVERVRTVDVQRTRFTIPADFDVEEYLRGAWGILRGELVTVKVIFGRAVARYIKERLWHPSQKLRELEDGRVEVTLRVADTLEVRRWILGYGAQAEVIEPVSLRDALRAEAEAMVRQLPPVRRPLAASPRRPSRGVSTVAPAVTVAKAARTASPMEPTEASAEMTS